MGGRASLDFTGGFMPTAESAPPGAKRSSEPLAIRAALDRAVGAFPLASRFLIALSGGIDSVVLLHAAQALDK